MRAGCRLYPACEAFKHACSRGLGSGGTKMLKKGGWVLAATKHLCSKPPHVNSNCHYGMFKGNYDIIPLWGGDS